MAKIKAVIVTQDYLDDKLATQYSDLVKVMRKVDEKVLAQAKRA